MQLFDAVEVVAEAVEWAKDSFFTMDEEEGEKLRLRAVNLFWLLDFARHVSSAERCGARFLFWFLFVRSIS